MDRELPKRRWTLGRVAGISGAGLLLALLMYTWLWADSKTSVRVERDKLSIAPVKQEIFIEYITVDGIVVPMKTVFLDAVEGGAVEVVHVEDGQELQEGQLMLTLSNSALQLDYVNRETQILELITQIDNARLNLSQKQTERQSQIAEIDYSLGMAERRNRQNKELFAQKAISENEYQQAKDEYEYLLTKKRILQKAMRQDSILTTAQLKQMDWSVQRMRQNLELVKQNLEHLEVRAPVSGKLSAFEAERGQLINKGQRMGQIDVPEGNKLRAQIDEHYLNRVVVGQQGEAEISGKVYTVEVGKIYPEVKNGTFTAELLFVDIPPAGLKKGQTLSLKLPLGTGQPAVLLRRGGFLSETGGRWVFVLDENGQAARRRNIQTGRTNPQQVEILDGLQPGEQVVISGYTGYEDMDVLKFE